MYLFIANFNRLKPLISQLSFFKQIDDLHIYILDHGSTYPPLLEYYDQLDDDQITVVQRTREEVAKANATGTIPLTGCYWHWNSGFIDDVVPHGEPYITTESDLVPTEDCPIDFLSHILPLFKGESPLRIIMYLRHNDIPKNNWIDPICAETARRQGRMATKSVVLGNGKQAKVLVGLLQPTGLCIYKNQGKNKPWHDIYYGHSQWTMLEPYSYRHIPYYIDPLEIEQHEEEYYYMTHLDKGSVYCKNLYFYLKKIGKFK